MNERVSYWLIPAEPDKSRLAKIIADLAQRFNAPVFEPHVTLYSGPFDSGDNLDELLRAATNGLLDVTLRPTGISFSAQFTKTLFIDFAPNEVLSQISAELKRLSKKPIDYELKPHLSLLYAPLASDVKEKLAQEFALPATIRFAVVKAMATRASTRTREDVEAWRVLAERAFATH